MTTDKQLQQPIEVRRRERGHDFYPPARQLGAIPPLYGTDGAPNKDKVVHLHYFTGGNDWWVVEYDRAENLAFGYVCLGDPDMAEWGYISLAELEELYIEGRSERQPDGRVMFRAPVVVERDLSWSPRPFGEVQLPRRR